MHGPRHAVGALKPGELSGADLTQPEALALVRDLLASGVTVRIRATGRSMGPLLPSGAFVHLRASPAAALRPGDLILTDAGPAALLLHRLVRREPTADGGLRLWTKGDALGAADAPVTATQVLGRACRIETASAAGIPCMRELDSRRWRLVGRLAARASVARRPTRWLLRLVVRLLAAG